MLDDVSTPLENNTVHHQNSLETSESGSLSSTDTLHTLKETHSMSKLSNQQQQHINNMINSYSLAGIMNDFDLVNLPLRELNKRLRVLPKQMAYNMKKRRRTLKNRKYAQNCRSKRLEQKSEMEVQNSQLKTEINRLNRTIEKLQKENIMLKSLMNKSDETKEKDISKLISANSKTHGMINTAQTVSSLSTSSSSSSSSNISQLTHLLSMPLSTKASNNSNAGIDHYNHFNQSATKL